MEAQTSFGTLEHNGATEMSSMHALEQRASSKPPRQSSQP